MNTTTYLTQSVHKLRSLRKQSDELPSFEEAFNQDYLRQFFRSAEGSSASPANSKKRVTKSEEIDMINFNLDYNSYKDQLVDDTGYSIPDTNDTYISPQKDSIINKNSLKNKNVQFGSLTNARQNLETSFSDPFNRELYTVLNGTNYNERFASNLFSSNNLPTVQAVKPKKKVFLIIRNAGPTMRPDPLVERPNDNSTESNIEKASRKRGKGQRRVKDRLKSADNINVDSFNNKESIKRRASYATNNDLQPTKKTKIQKDSKDDLDGSFEFDMDPDKDFKPGFFDVLPTISFEEIINRDYPEFTGSASGSTSNF